MKLENKIGIKGMSNDQIDIINQKTSKLLRSLLNKQFKESIPKH